MFKTANVKISEGSFIKPRAALAALRNYAFYSQFDVGFASNPEDPHAICAGGTGGLRAQHHVRSTSSTLYDRASVEGYSGYLNFDRSTSSDGRHHH